MGSKGDWHSAICKFHLQLVTPSEAGREIDGTMPHFIELMLFPSLRAVLLTIKKMHITQ
jgi:hypothetical protein